MGIASAAAGAEIPPTAGPPRRARSRSATRKRRRVMRTPRCSAAVKLRSNADPGPDPASAHAEARAERSPDAGRRDPISGLTSIQPRRPRLPRDPQVRRRQRQSRSMRSAGETDDPDQAIRIVTSRHSTRDHRVVQEAMVQRLRCWRSNVRHVTASSSPRAPAARRCPWLRGHRHGRATPPLHQPVGRSC